MLGMRREPPILGHPVHTVRPLPPTRPWRPARPPAPYDPVGRLPDALGILAARMRVAITERRDAPPGSEQYRHADELVGYLNELYLRLQRRIEIPRELWRLGGGAPARDSRSRLPRTR